MSAGATTFVFLDFDIFSALPTTIGSPVSTRWARRAAPLKTDHFGLHSACSGGGLCMRDHALGEQTVKRLGGRQRALIAKSPCDEAGVQQMEHRVFHAADILIYREPIVGGGTVDRLACLLGRQIWKYHDEFTNVSSVSVSRSAAAPQLDSRFVSRWGAARARCPAWRESGSRAARSAPAADRCGHCDEVLGMIRGR